MNDPNWWLMGLSLVLGALLTFAQMIRRVKREVPVTHSVVSANSAVGHRGVGPRARVADEGVPRMSLAGADVPSEGGAVDNADVSGRNVDVPDVRVPGGATTDADVGVAGSGHRLDTGAAAAGAASSVVAGATAAATSRSRLGAPSQTIGEPYGSGSARAGADGSGPADWRIKGDEATMRYFTPDDRSYRQTTAHVWFRDEDSAMRGGFAPSREDDGRGAGTASSRAAAKTYGPGSMRVALGGNAPRGYTVKGNEDSMLYHTPDSPSYQETIAEIWFQDEQSAVRAGFARWDNGQPPAGTAGAPAIEPGPYGLGSSNPGADGGGPPGWTVKGNEDSMLYHTPDSPSYQETIAEIWFQDEQSAKRAGFGPWHKGRNTK